jgi:PAS domain S-box-containing protein
MNRMLKPTRAGIREAFIALFVAGAYYVTGYYGIVAKVPPAGITTVWPPAAIILAALLLTPRRLWWTYLIVVGATHLYLFVKCMPTMTPMTMAFQFLGYGGQAWLAAEAMRRFGGLPPRLNNLRSVTTFILLGAIAAPLVASTLVVYLYTLTGWVGDYWLVWRQRLIANVVPTLTLTPLIVLTVKDGVACMRRTSVRGYLEFAGLLVVVVGVAFGVFGWKSAGHEAVPALLYALLPLLLWAAVRFEPAALYSCLVLIGAISLINAYHGRGPFLTLSRDENVLALQLFLVAMSVPVILLGALVQERRNTEMALRDSQHRYSLATAAGAAGVWDWNVKTGELYLDPAVKALLGFEDDEIQNTMEGWTQCMHPDDVEPVLELVQAHLTGASPSLEAEHRAFHKDGSIRWFLCRGVVVERIEGVPVRMMGTDTDITERKLAERELHERNERIRELAGRLISAQEEERRRIARDLHDDLNQKVAALSIEISNVKHHLPTSSGGLAEKLTNLQARTAELVRDIRKLSHEIHPATLDHAGLVPALTSFAAELNRLEGIEVNLAMPAAPARIPPPIATCIYRVAQESIRNVIRHSGAKRVALALSVEDDVVTFFVQDEGRGFDVTRMKEHGGLGLISIEERVRLVNGRLEVRSRPGGGTFLSVQVPLATESVAALS